MPVPRFCFAHQALLTIRSNKFLDPYNTLAKLGIHPVGRYFAEGLNTPHFCYSVDQIEKKFKVKFLEKRTMTFSQSLRIKFVVEQDFTLIENASKKELPREARKRNVKVEV